MCFKNSNKSFTIIELLIVIGILSILFSIGIPAFRAYQPALQLSGTVREITTDIRYAEKMAVNEQINHGVRFSTSSNQYQIIRFGATEEVLETKSLPDQISFCQISGLSESQVVFNPYGAALESGSVVLINNRNTTTTITIRPSGFVKIIK